MSLRIRLIFLLSLILLCCSPDPQSPSGDSEEDGGVEGGGSSSGGVYNLSIAALKSRYVAASHKLTDVIFISGTITANDYMGEYPNTLLVEDDTAAIAVSVDLDGALSAYPIAGEVTINCTDLWLGSSGGVLYLGCEPTGEYVVDAIECEDFEACTSVVTEGVTARAPQCVTLSELTPQLVSCYLKLEGMRFLPNEEGVDTFCALDPDTGRRISTSHTLEEVATAEQIKLYVVSTVDYANELLPEGEGDLYVTLESYAGSYSVRLVSHRFSFE